MKRTLYILLAAFAIIACGEKADPENQGGNNNNTENSGNQGGSETPETLASKIMGDWHSTSLPVTGDIYFSLAEDNVFELYQKIGDGGYRLYRGTWSINEEKALLSGKYNDGSDWAASYSVTLDKDILTLTSDNDVKEKSTYKKESIPTEVKEGCVVVVKSEASESPVL